MLTHFVIVLRHLRTPPERPLAFRRLRLYPFFFFIFDKSVLFSPRFFYAKFLAFPPYFHNLRHIARIFGKFFAIHNFIFKGQQFIVICFKIVCFDTILMRVSSPVFIVKSVIYAFFVCIAFYKFIFFTVVLSIAAMFAHFISFP